MSAYHKQRKQGPGPTWTQNVHQSFSLNPKAAQNRKGSLQARRALSSPEGGARALDSADDLKACFCKKLQPSLIAVVVRASLAGLDLAKLLLDASEQLLHLLSTPTWMATSEERLRPSWCAPPKSAHSSSSPTARMLFRANQSAARFAEKSRTAHTETHRKARAHSEVSTLEVHIA